jgi:hypothetical protein
VRNPFVCLSSGESSSLDVSNTRRPLTPGFSHHPAHHPPPLCVTHCPPTSPGSEELFCLIIQWTLIDFTSRPLQPTIQDRTRTLPEASNETANPSEIEANPIDCQDLTGKFDSNRRQDHGSSTRTSICTAETGSIPGPSLRTIGNSSKNRSIEEHHLSSPPQYDRHSAQLVTPPYRTKVNVTRAQAHQKALEEARSAGEQVINQTFEVEGTEHNKPAMALRAANRRAGPCGKRGPTMSVRPGRAPSLSDSFQAILSRSGCLIGGWGCRLCSDVLVPTTGQYPSALSDQNPGFLGRISRR